MSSIVTYKEVVDTVRAACDAHLAVQSFAEGPISFLDAQSVNVRYPFCFLRPLASPGLQDNVRTLNFELFMLDVPKLSDEAAVQIKSRTELFLYDIAGYLRYGPTNQYTMDFNLSTITPVDEAFQDRAFGWVGSLAVTSNGIYNYCNFPD